MDLTEWAPDRRKGTLVITNVWILDAAPDTKPKARAMPKGDKGLVLRIVAWLCGNHTAPVTSMAKVKDTYVAVAPLPEQPRDPETGEIVKNKDGSAKTTDRRRDMARQAVTRLVGDGGWLRLDGDVITITARDLPDEWFNTPPGADLPHAPPDPFLPSPSIQPLPSTHQG